MTFKIIEIIEDSQDDETRSLVQIVETSTEHVAVDFEKSRYTKVDRFRFETGFVQLEEGVKVELTRILMSCSSNHDHGVYYQAPRMLDIWEAMFAIGEIGEANESVPASE